MYNKIFSAKLTGYRTFSLGYDSDCRYEDFVMGDQADFIICNEEYEVPTDEEISTLAKKVKTGEYKAYHLSATIHGGVTVRITPDDYVSPDPWDTVNDFGVLVLKNPTGDEKKDLEEAEYQLFNLHQYYDGICFCAEIEHFYDGVEDSLGCIRGENERDAVLNSVFENMELSDEDKKLITEALDEQF